MIALYIHVCGSDGSGTDVSDGYRPSVLSVLSSLEIHWNIIIHPFTYPKTDMDKYDIAIPFLVEITFATLGLVGNGIAFCTFGKMCNRNASIYLLRALAVVDSIYLIVFLLGHGTPFSVLEAMGSFQDYFLFIIIAMFDINHTTTVWTVLLVGVHRYIVVCHPLRAARLCTVGNARRHLFGILLFSFIVNLPLIVASALSGVKDGDVYDLTKSRWFHIGFRLVFVRIIVDYTIPVACLIFITVRLTKSLRSSRQRRMELSEGQRQSQTTSRTEWMVVVVLIIFLVCQTGFPLRLVLQRLEIVGKYNKSLYFVLWHLGWIMLVLNSSINFIVYLLFNQKFRKTLCPCVTSQWNNHQPAAPTW